jgi:hypothetical protein
MMLKLLWAYLIFIALCGVGAVAVWLASLALYLGPGFVVLVGIGIATGWESPASHGNRR